MGVGLTGPYHTPPSPSHLRISFSSARTSLRHQHRPTSPACLCWHLRATIPWYPVPRLLLIHLRRSPTTQHAYHLDCFPVPSAHLNKIHSIFSASLCGPAPLSCQNLDNLQHSTPCASPLMNKSDKSSRLNNLLAVLQYSNLTLPQSRS
jgi:hypothetical protein